MEQSQVNMNTQMDDLSPSESLSADIRDAWRQLPDKAFFFSILAAWLAMFHIVGNATRGYVNTPSLFGWMYDAYSKSGLDGEDGHGLLIPFVVIGIFWWKRKWCSSSC